MRMPRLGKAVSVLRDAARSWMFLRSGSCWTRMAGVIANEVTYTIWQGELPDALIHDLGDGDAPQSDSSTTMVCTWLSSTHEA